MPRKKPEVKIMTRKPKLKERFYRLNAFEKASAAYDLPCGLAFSFLASLFSSCTLLWLTDLLNLGFGDDMS